MFAGGMFTRRMLTRSLVTGRIFTRGVFTRRARLAGLVIAARLGIALERHIFFYVFRRRQSGAVHLHERRRHQARIARLKQFIGHQQVIFAGSFRQQRIVQQPFLIQLADLGRGGRTAPGGVDAGAAQHFLGFAAA